MSRSNSTNDYINDAKIRLHAIIAIAASPTAIKLNPDRKNRSFFVLPILSQKKEIFDLSCPLAKPDLLEEAEIRIASENFEGTQKVGEEIINSAMFENYPKLVSEGALNLFKKRVSSNCKEKPAILQKAFNLLTDNDFARAIAEAKLKSEDISLMQFAYDYDDELYKVLSQILEKSGIPFVINTTVRDEEYDADKSSYKGDSDNSFTSTEKRRSSLDISAIEAEARRSSLSVPLSPTMIRIRKSFDENTPSEIPPKTRYESHGSQSLRSSPLSHESRPSNQIITKNVSKSADDLTSVGKKPSNSI